MLPDCKSGRTFLALLPAGHSWLLIKYPTPTPLRSGTRPDPTKGGDMRTDCWTRPVQTFRRQHRPKREGICTPTVGLDPYRLSADSTDPKGRGYAHRLLDKTSWHRKRNGIFMKEQVTKWTPYFARHFHSQYLD